MINLNTPNKKRRAMNQRITGINIPLTRSLKDHVEDKTKKIRTTFDKITSIEVTLKVEKGEQTAEISAHANGHTFHAKVSSENMYKSIDEVSHKMFRQIRRQKEKNTNYNAKVKAEDVTLRLEDAQILE